MLAGGSEWSGGDGIHVAELDHFEGVTVFGAERTGESQEGDKSCYVKSEGRGAMGLQTICRVAVVRDKCSKMSVSSIH